MSFDPGVISDIGGSGPDVAGSIAKGYQLKDLATDGQFNQLKLNAAKADQLDQKTIRDILSKSDLSTEKGLAEASERLTRAGQPQQAMELQKYGQSITNGQLDQQVKQLQVHEASQAAVVSVIDPIVQKADAMRQAGQSDAMIQAYLQAQTPLAMQQLQQAGLPQQAMQGILKQLQSGPVTYDRLKSFEQSSKAGQDAIRQRLQDLNISSEIDTRTKQQSNIDSEISARDQKSRDQKDGGSLSPEGQNLVDQLSLKDQSFMTRLSAQGIRARNKTINDWASQGVTVDDVLSGRISYKGDTAAGVSLGKQDATLAKVENALNRSGGVGDQAISAADAVDFGKVRALNGVSSWFGRQVSDPKLAAYIVKMQALTSEYAQVITRGSASTEGARDEAQKKIDSLQSPEAVRAMVAAIKQETATNRAAIRDERAKVGKPQTDTSSATGGWSISPVQ